jgi:hypothetical protein
VTSTGELWLGRYERPLPLRSRGSFHLVSARLPTGEARVVMIPGPRADVARVAEALSEVERVHRLLRHPLVPGVARLDRAGTTPFLELDFDAVADGSELLHLLADTNQKIDYPQADALIVQIREALQTAHAVTDPRTGRPLCLGKLTYGNLLFSRTGAIALIGFGHNVAAETELGTVEPSATVFQAPEVALGAAATPRGDYVALLLFLRSLVPFACMTPTIGRVVSGDVRPSDVAVLESLRQFEERAMLQTAAARASVDELVALSGQIRELLGTTLDHDGLRRRLAELLELHDDDSLLDIASETAGPAASVALTDDARWFEGSDGCRHSLGRPARRVLLALVAKHRAQPGSALTVWQILEAGWPGEQPAYEAALNRVYVTIARLRKLGLRDVVERFDDGYRIAPGARIRAIDPARS